MATERPKMKRCPTCGGRHKTATCHVCDPPLADLDNEGLPWTDDEIADMVRYTPTSDEIDASTRIIRYFGFIGQDGRFHPPWTDDDHKRRAGLNRAPFELPGPNPPALQKRACTEFLQSDNEGE